MPRPPSPAHPLSLPAPGVLVNDTDADGDVLTATGATQPAHGSVTLARTAPSPTRRLPASPARTRSPTGPTTAGNLGACHGDASPSAGTGAGDGATSGGRRRRCPSTYGTVRHGLGGGRTGGRRPARSSCSEGSTALATAAVADGRATLVLRPRVRCPPGVHGLTLRYGGDATHKASSSTVWVGRGEGRRRPWRSRRRRRSTAVSGPRMTGAALRAPGSVAVDGQVQRADQERQDPHRELRNGRVKLLLPKAMRPRRDS